MGTLIVYCAGTSVDVLPGNSIHALLLNVPNNGNSERAVRESKNLIRVSQAKTTMLDSGGYQLFVAEQEKKEIIYDEKIPPIQEKDLLNLTPTHVIWAAERIRPDIVVALDFPIGKIKEKEKQEVEFRRKLGFNVDWAIQTAELREKHCPRIKLFLPIQCYNLDHLERYRRLVEGVPFDGYSMPVRNLGVGEIARFLSRFYQLGVRQVHLLGTLKFFTIALSAYAARHFFDWVSLDATTWRLLAQDSMYMNPHDLTGEYIGDDAMIDPGIRMDCLCPWCRTKTFTYIKRLPFKVREEFLRCHNFSAVDRVSRELFENSESITTLERYLKRKSRRQAQVGELVKILAILEKGKTDERAWELLK
jgi:tRNA-guanine family transglycosylase